MTAGSMTAGPNGRPTAPAPKRPTAPVAPTTLGDPLRASALAIERDLNATFAERERENRGIVIALLAKEHILLLGPAGTGKSALANTTCGAITGAAFFQWLLTRFSAPEEVFGPISLDGLKQGVYDRITKGKLPEAHVVFLDEIYKANSAVLNSLLTALNERAFDTATGRTRIPLEICVGASNELPEGPELAALHDRFMLRFWVAYTKTPQAFARLLVGAEPSISSTWSLADLRQAQANVAAMPVDPNAVDELFKLRGELQKEGIVASDRRWRKVMSILRAVAWLDGASMVTQETFPILSHVLWETVDQIVKIQKLVAKYTSAELARAQEAFDAMSELISGMPAKGTAEFSEQVPRVLNELKKAIASVENEAKICTAVQSKVRIEKLVADLTRKRADLNQSAREALGID
jgi:MoxR-like ATPase